MLSPRLLTPLFVALVPLLLPAQTLQRAGPNPVEASALGYDASNGTLYAGTASGVLARSTDGGAHWTRLSLPARIGESIDGVAARGAKILVAASTREIYRLRLSTDSGRNWQEREILGINPYGVRAVGLTEGTMWIIDKSKKARISRDGGTTWSPLFARNPELRVSAIATGETEIVAATESGIRRSTDQGMTWSEGMGSITDEVDEMAFNGKGLVAVGRVDAPDGLRTLLRLYSIADRDGGTATTLPFPDIENVNRTYAHCIAAAGDTVLVGVFRNYHHLIGETRLMRTVDAGAHWTSCPGIDSLGLLTMIRAHDRIVLGDGTRLLVSQDEGATFTPTGTELAGTHVEMLAGTDTPVAAGGGYLYTSTNGRFHRVGYEAWTAPPYRLLAARGSTILATTGNPMESYGSSILLRSTDNGTTWKEVEKGLQVRSPLHSDGRTITVPLDAIADDGKTFAALSLRGIFLSTDGGASWRAVDGKRWEKLMAEEDLGEINGIAISRGTIIVSAEGGLIQGSTTRGGWKKLRSWPNDWQPGAISAHNSVITVAAGGSLWSSTTDGATWQQSNATEWSEITALTREKRREAVIADGRVWISSNGTWQEVPLPDGVQPVSLHLTSNDLWIGTAADGVWRMSRGEEHGDR